jgi:hypothetical protein
VKLICDHKKDVGDKNLTVRTERPTGTSSKKLWCRNDRKGEIEPEIENTGKSVMKRFNEIGGQVFICGQQTLCLNHHQQVMTKSHCPI